MGSESSFQELLLVLNESDCKIPGLSVVKTASKGEDDGNDFEIHFEELQERIQTPNATVSPFTPFSKDYKPNTNNEELDEIRSQVASCMSSVHVTHNHLETKYDSLQYMYGTL